jgi:O-antigen/teichoic acid export membrane protein
VVLVGERWRASAPIAAVLVLTGPAQTLQSYAGGLFNAIGRPDITLRYRLLTAALNIAGFLIAVLVFHDALAVAVAYAVRAYILAPVTLTWIQRHTGIPFVENMLRLRRIATATLVMTVMVLFVKVLLRESVGPGILLMLEIAVGAATYLATMLLIEHDLVLDVWQFFLQAMPGRIRARLFGARHATS